MTTIASDKLAEISKALPNLRVITFKLQKHSPWLSVVRLAESMSFDIRFGKIKLDKAESTQFFYYHLGAKSFELLIQRLLEEIPALKPELEGQCFFAAREILGQLGIRLRF